jgi:hypothetical protein
MDQRLDQDPPLEERRTDVRLFAAPTREDEHDSIYPMLAPAAAVTIGHEEDAFDEQILAGLVNV